MDKNEFATRAADVLLDELGDAFCWSGALRRWMAWDGECWEPTSDFEMLIEVSETLQNYWVKARSAYLESPEPTNPEYLQNLTDLLACARNKPAYLKAAMRLLRTLDGFRKEKL